MKIEDVVLDIKSRIRLQEDTKLGTEAETVVHHMAVEHCLESIACQVRNLM